MRQFTGSRQTEKNGSQKRLYLHLVMSGEKRRFEDFLAFGVSLQVLPLICHLYEVTKQIKEAPQWQQ